MVFAQECRRPNSAGLPSQDSAINLEFDRNPRAAKSLWFGQNKTIAPQISPRSNHEGKLYADGF